ncbi:MAG: hypothetical protein EAZ09_10715 [Oscillatoriales cyanobacterium]|nr:MAG: hypothetical protein EAZ18_04685 [Oscillatoriales cyanobacterium]TAH22412.1 MAG: hypothetical protein EAZ09_10715 [Oscillatoriales cyanobacterium]
MIDLDFRRNHATTSGGKSQVQKLQGKLGAEIRIVNCGLGLHQWRDRAKLYHAGLYLAHVYRKIRAIASTI